MAAGIKRPAPIGDVAGGASMRPRPNGRGNEQQRLGAGAPGVASMRPRPNGRGNAQDPLAELLAQRASMRPRPNGRGNRVVVVVASDLVVSFNEAAAEWPRE